MKKIILTLCAILLCTMTTFAQNTLIDYGAGWRYYDAGNQPPNNGSSSWEQEGYFDGNWASGNAQLGYGDGDETTPINSGVYTAYFRHNFFVADASMYDNINLELIYDDGAVVYLNGNEIWRVNMPNGNIDYNTFADPGPGDNTEASSSIISNLKNGTNVIAIEVHQDDANSSDISFDFQLVGLAAGSVQVSRGPYLQKASPTSMMLRWRTATPASSGIRYGTNINNLDQVRVNNTQTTEHEIELTNLSPATVYYYEIINGAATILPAAQDLYFKTSPLPDTDAPINAWILGDCGTANANQRAVRNAYYNYIGDEHTDMILFLGDNAYNSGTDEEYQYALFENMYEDKLKNSVSWSCLGNHDGFTADSDSQQGPYYEIFNLPKNGESGGLASGTEAYYSFDYGNIHFIVLDSYDSDRSVGGAMHTWCENDIQNTTAEWIVAFWHHPPYSKSSNNSDALADLIQMRQNFLPILESNGVDLVLSGHSHSYERSYFINGHYGYSSTFDPTSHIVQSGSGKENQDGHYQKFTVGNRADDGAIYVVTGNAGKVDSGVPLNHNAMYYGAATLGSTLLNVHNDTLRVKFLRETGNIDDYFTIVKNDSCPAGTPCNDNNPCTSNDVYDTQCNCTGTAASGVSVDVGEDITNCTGEITLNATVSNPDNNLNYQWKIYNEANVLINTLTGNNIPVTLTSNSRIELTVSYQADCPLGSDQFIYTFAGDDDNDGICNTEDPCNNSTNGNPCSDNNFFTVNDALQDCECIGCYRFDLKVQLEGAYNSDNQLMNNGLYQRGLLPGQVENLPVGTPTPPGQPYNITPWNYDGIEGIDWTAANYTDDIVDWVLVSFRTGIEKNTQFAQAAGLLHTNGEITFPNPCVLNGTHPTTMYIVIQQRNHIGVMSPQPISIIAGILRHDFSLSDSYRDATGFGQKQLPNGKWVMYAGDANALDMPSYDINSGDKTLWFKTNGSFNNYLPTDMNLDGDINGADKAIWEINNGVSSRVPK